MGKLVPIAKRAEDKFQEYLFFCPGCQENHCISDSWKFNGDLLSPTFSPSYLLKYSRYKKNKGLKEWEDMICHSFITAGKIAYCSESTHDLKGKTVDLPEYDL